MSSSDSELRDRSRDAQVGVLLGVFFVALAVAVLAGSLFAQAAIDRAINLVSALLLALVGGIFLWRARIAAVRAGRSEVEERGDR